KTRALVERLTAIDGVSSLFRAPAFHEAVLKLPRPAAELLPALAEHGVLGGYDLSELYPELGNALLVCATETKTDADLDAYGSALRAALSNG
ncbi:MAG: glycine dehydrogenase, partial [Woeseia sp.]|nr:glycine dehydrogenase [Woeseia sp.]